MDDEDFLAMVAMQRVGATWWLAGTANIETVWFADMHELMGVLGHTGPDDREVFLFVAAGTARVDERVGAWPQF